MADRVDERPAAAPPAAEARPPGRGAPASAIAIGVAAVVMLGVGLVVASGRGSGSESDWAGRPVDPPVALPSVVLTDTSGAPYRLSEQDEGTMTLLFFGYLSCPDVCPIQMAVLAQALDDLAADVRARIRVVFVTTDPARDTPAAMRRWLDSFDPGFVGLTGTADDLADAQAGLRLPVAVTEPPADDGSYLVGHATQVLAFGSDGLARISYPFGVRKVDWVQDLPRLVAGEHP